MTHAGQLIFPATLCWRLSPPPHIQYTVPPLFPSLLTPLSSYPIQSFFFPFLPFSTHSSIFPTLLNSLLSLPTLLNPSSSLSYPSLLTPPSSYPTRLATSSSYLTKSFFFPFLPNSTHSSFLLPYSVLPNSFFPITVNSVLLQPIPLRLYNKWKLKLR